MLRAASPRRLNATHPYLLDSVLAVVVVGMAVVPLAVGAIPGDRFTVADGTGAILALVLLPVRRRARLAVLALAVASLVGCLAVTSQVPAALVATVLVAMYTVASASRRRVAVSAALPTAAVGYVALVLWSTHSVTASQGLAFIAWTGMAAAVGGAVRSQRNYVAAVEDRAVRAEATREEEARRQVAEERLRIARELHDVIAHHIALINVQAGVASHLLRSSPDQADKALGHIRDAGTTVLDELGSLLYVLRQSGDDRPSTEPAPGLDGLGHLLESFSATGLPVQHRVVYAPRPVPATVDLAAYRIIQEGLTNARKHGAGGVELTVAYRPRVLHIQISNAGAGRSGPGTGHGLIGMRERAQAVGGSLSTAVDSNGRFHLDAQLPIPDEVHS